MNDFSWALQEGQLPENGKVLGSFSFENTNGKSGKRSMSRHGSLVPKYWNPTQQTG